AADACRGDARLGDGVPRARAERLVLRARGFPPPRARVDAHPRVGVPDRAGVQAALRRRRHRVRDDVLRHCGAVVLRSRLGGDPRPLLGIRRSAASMKRALAVAVLVALTLPASAFAHASLRKEAPGFRQRLAASPRQVVLQFDQTVDALPKAIVVLPRLRKGPYTVRWQALSNDGHIVSGVYTFGVKVPAPPVTDAVGAQGPTRTEDVVRWLYFLGLALAVGGIGFKLL